MSVDPIAVVSFLPNIPKTKAEDKTFSRRGVPQLLIKKYKSIKEPFYD